MADINLKGMGVALITPFKEDESVDYEALARLVDYQLQNGTDYLVVLGTTAETPTLTEEEKKNIIRQKKAEISWKCRLRGVRQAGGLSGAERYGLFGSAGYYSGNPYTYGRRKEKHYKLGSDSCTGPYPYRIRRGR